MAKALLHLSLFVAALLAGATYIRSLDAMPFWGAGRKKTSYLSRALGEYDTLFLGSSRFNNMVIPEVFDGRMAELGVETRSFNLGMRGLRVHDYDALIDWLLTQDHEGLDRVVIELYTYDLYLRDGSWMTSFTTEMHAPAHLTTRLQSNWMSKHTFVEKWEIAWFAIAHSAVNFFRIGQGGRIVKDLSVVAQGRRYSPGKELPERGFSALDPENAPSKKRLEQHRKWRADPESARKMVERRRKTVSPESMCGGFNLDAFRHQVERLRRAGIEPIYVVMPQISWGFRGRDGVAEAAKIATVVEIDSPADVPELYELDLWFDSNHMLRSGAEALSKRLAEEMRPVLAKDRKPK